MNSMKVSRLSVYDKVFGQRDLVWAISIDMDQTVPRGAIARYVQFVFKFSVDYSNILGFQKLRT